VSVSTEIGWVGRQFAEDTWSWEIRPIIDKKAGRWYVSLNPAIEKSLRGTNSGRGFEFAPALNVKYDVTPKIAAGIEYYSGLGPISHFDPRAEQMQQIFPSIDLAFSTSGFLAVFAARNDMPFRLPDSSPSSRLGMTCLFDFRIPRSLRRSGRSVRWP
jgi:hypothetical protein